MIYHIKLSHLITESAHDLDNRLGWDNSFFYTYDNEGNLIRKRDRVTGDFTTYTYDAENRLIGADTPTSSVSYRYDGLGRRIEKSTDGRITRYVYDSEDILLEFDATNALMARYTHGPGIDEPLIMERSGPSFYFHGDGLGSIRELSVSTGAVVQSYVYDSYGRLVGQMGTLINPYTYTGREFDPELGFYYYRARHYDPRTGRFIQQDPLGLRSGDVNPYRYGLNNPIKFKDPDGKVNFNFVELAGKEAVDWAFKKAYEKLNEAAAGTVLEPIVGNVAAEVITTIVVGGAGIAGGVVAGVLVPSETVSEQSEAFELHKAFEEELRRRGLPPLPPTSSIPELDPFAGQPQFRPPSTCPRRVP